MPEEQVNPNIEALTPNREPVSSTPGAAPDRRESRARDRRGGFDSLLDLRDSIIRGRRRMLAEVLDVLADTADSIDRDEEEDYKGKPHDSDARHSGRERRRDRIHDRFANGI